MPEIENAEIGKLISEFLKHEKPESRAVFIRKYWFFDSVSDIVKHDTHIYRKQSQEYAVSLP